MICHRIGRPPISTIGFGSSSVTSLRRVPCPPHRITTFIRSPLSHSHIRFPHRPPPTPASWGPLLLHRVQRAPCSPSPPPENPGRPSPPSPSDSRTTERAVCDGG